MTQGPLRTVKIGTIGKPHGLKGEMRIRLSDDRFWEFLGEQQYVVLRGLPYSLLACASNGPLRIRVEGVDNRTTAERFKGADLEVVGPLPELEPEETANPYVELLGFSILDVNSERMIGPISEIFELPTQWTAVVPLAEGEALIPLHPDFIEAIEAKDKVARMRLPEGLLDLYDAK